MMDNPIAQQVQTLVDYLNDTGIDVHTRHLADGRKEVEAFKSIGNTIKHVSIIGTDLLDILIKLVHYIESEIEQWIEQELY